MTAHTSRTIRIAALVVTALIAGIVLAVVDSNTTTWLIGVVIAGVLLGEIVGRLTKPSGAPARATKP